MVKEKVYLSIAGYIILIRFFPSEWRSKELFIGKFKKDYSYYILHFTPNSVHFTINIIDGDQASINRNRNDDNIVFVQYYKEVSKNVIESYYRIGSQLLQLLLQISLVKIVNPKTTFYLHGSAVTVNKKGIIFLGAAGAGKSTAIKLLKPKYRSINDDSVILKKEGKQYFIYQTPFKEKAYWIDKKGERLPLGGVVFLHKSEKYRIKKMTNKEEILKRFSRQIIGYNLPDDVSKHSLKFVFANNFFYSLYFGRNGKKLKALIKEKLSI